MPRSRFCAKAIEAHVRNYQADEVREALDELLLGLWPTRPEPRQSGAAPIG